MAEVKIETTDKDGSTSVWSRHSVVSLPSCGCSCSLVALGCLAVIAALFLCGAALVVLLATCVSFLSHLLFGAA